jgi:hypothetical protein
VLILSLLFLVIAVVVIAFAVVSLALFVFVVLAVTLLAFFCATRKISLVTAVSAITCAAGAALFGMTVYWLTDRTLVDPSLLIWSTVGFAWGGGVTAILAGGVAAIAGAVRALRSLQNHPVS